MKNFSKKNFLAWFRFSLCLIFVPLSLSCADSGEAEDVYVMPILEEISGFWEFYDPYLASDVVYILTEEGEFYTTYCSQLALAYHVEGRFSISYDAKTVNFFDVKITPDPNSPNAPIAAFSTYFDDPFSWDRARRLLRSPKKILYYAEEAAICP